MRSRWVAAGLRGRSQSISGFSGSSRSCYDYRYSDEELERLAEWAGGKPAYVMLNNSNMKEDAQRFMRLLSRRTPRG